MRPLAAEPREPSRENDEDGEVDPRKEPGYLEPAQEARGTCSSARNSEDDREDRDIERCGDEHSIAREEAEIQRVVRQQHEDGRDDQRSGDARNR